VSKPAAIPLFGDAYLADTTHLTTEEHGAYLLLMMAAWRQEDCALPDDDRKLARIAGLSLRKWGVIKSTIMDFWTLENGRIFQGRLRKEHAYVVQKSESNRKNAASRWEAQRTENKQDGGMRSQCDGNAPPPPPIRKKELQPKGCSASGDALTPQDVFESWNEMAPKFGLPVAKGLTPARKRHTLARLREYPAMEDWQRAFRHIADTPWLCGDNDRGWRADYDFLVQAKSFTKLVEGSYGKN
jgi:uncharacterized protein YdaU (DUF1376 family)